MTDYRYYSKKTGPTKDEIFWLVRTEEDSSVVLQCVQPHRDTTIRVTHSVLNIFWKEVQYVVPQVVVEDAISIPKYKDIFQEMWDSV